MRQSLGSCGQASTEQFVVYGFVMLSILLVLGVAGFFVLSSSESAQQVAASNSCVTGVSTVQCGDVVASEGGVRARLFAVQRSLSVEKVAVLHDGEEVCVAAGDGFPIPVLVGESAELVIRCNQGNTLPKGQERLELVFDVIERGRVFARPVVASVMLEVTERCTATSDCPAGLSCDTGTGLCSTGMTRGEDTSLFSCIGMANACDQTSSSCGVDGVCVVDGGVAVSGACNADRQCVSGASCLDGVCKSGLGGMCSASEQCVSGASCLGGVCKSGLGGMCSASEQCVSGASCLNRLCVADGTVALGGACSARQQCASDVCGDGSCGYKFVVVAGTGAAGFMNGTGSAAQFNAPRDVELSGNNLLVADSGNHVVRLLTPDEDGGYDVSTIAGGARFARLHDDVFATSARFNQPAGLAVDSGGKVFVTDAGNNRVRLLTPKESGDYAASTIAGSGEFGLIELTGDGGLALEAQFSRPHGIALDGAGNLFVADRRHDVVRVLRPNPGTDPVTYNVSTINTTARFSAPNDVLVDSVGRLFVTDVGNNSVRLLTLDNQLRYISADLDQGFDQPHGVALDGDGNLFVSDFSSRVFLLTPDGSGGYDVSTIAGTGIDGAGVSGDGSALNSQFARPRGLAVDDRGNVFVADANNHRIVKLCPNASNC